MFLASRLVRCISEPKNDDMRIEEHTDVCRVCTNIHMRTGRGHYNQAVREHASSPERGSPFRLKHELTKLPPDD